MWADVQTGVYSCQLNIMDALEDTFNNMEDNHMNVKIDGKKNNKCTVHVPAQMQTPKMMSFLTFPTHSWTNTMSTQMLSHDANTHQNDVH